MQKEFFETTLPARLKKYEGFLESRDGGKAYFFGEKVRKMRKIHKGVKLNFRKGRFFLRKQHYLSSQK